mmetsp:Transcript_3906/g.5474  ORF Transcript_3906/g.5474 Transcript_3906/m.5474 type:complete len:324 (-) Transcript_3906:157-1128(-)
MQLPRTKIKSTKQLLRVNKEIQQLQAKIKQTKKNGSGLSPEEKKLAVLKKEQQALVVELHREKIIKALNDELRKKIKVVTAKSKKCEQQIPQQTDSNLLKMFTNNLDTFKLKLNFLNEFLNNVNTSPKEKFQLPITEQIVSSLMDSQNERELSPEQTKIRSKLKESIIASQGVQEHLESAKISNNTTNANQEATTRDSPVKQKKQQQRTPPQEEKEDSPASPMETTNLQDQEEQREEEEHDDEEQQQEGSEENQEEQHEQSEEEQTEVVEEEEEGRRWLSPKKFQMKRKWESMLGEKHPSWSAKRARKLKEQKAIFSGKRLKL